MITLQIIIFSICAVLWVSANPAFQRQPCPIHGNVNVNSHAPIPSLVPPTYSQPVYTVGPTYQPTNTGPTTSPIQEELGQMIVQKLLSNPILQNIISQNSVPYQNVPNVVNNYFIVPSDLILNNSNSECVKPTNKVLLDNQNTLVKEANIGTIERLDNIERKVQENLIRQEDANRFVENHNRNDIPEGLIGNSNVPHVFRPQDLLQPDLRGLYEAFLRNRNCCPHRCHEGPYHNHRDVILKENTQIVRAPGEEYKIPMNRQRFGGKENTIPTEEVTLQDFRAKFPHIPEPIARNIIQQMRERVQKQYTNRKSNSRNLQRISDQNTRGNPQRRRSKNRRTKPRNETESVTQEDSKKSEVSTTKISDIETSTNRIDIDTNNANVNERQETTTAFNMPELGSEDELPFIVNGLDYDDFYPDFTRDNLAHSLDDIRPYVEETVREKPKNALRKNRKQRKQKNRQQVVKSEELTYRFPPGLETPDFITTQVNKKYGNDFDLKSFSDRNIRTLSEDLLPDIENVFAGSKVMNYGAKDSDEVAKDNSYYGAEPKVEVSNDGPSIVMAKSYAYPEDYE